MPSNHLTLWAIQIHKAGGAGKDTSPQAMSQACNKKATENRASAKRLSQGVNFNTPDFLSLYFLDPGSKAKSSLEIKNLTLLTVSYHLSVCVYIGVYVYTFLYINIYLYAHTHIA